MELIARIALRRYEMGEAAEMSPNRKPGTSLAIFRVQGKSPERAMKILTDEMAKEPDQVMVLAIGSKTLSEEQINTCESAMAYGMQKTTKIVFCGGDPRQLFDRLSVFGNVLKWFPSIQAYVSSHESEPDRHSASLAWSEKSPKQ